MDKHPLNVVQLQYIIMNALVSAAGVYAGYDGTNDVLRNATLDVEYNHNLIMSFLVSEKQRAKVTMAIVNRVFCINCGEEIINPCCSAFIRSN